MEGEGIGNRNINGAFRKPSVKSTFSRWYVFVLGRERLRECVWSEALILKDFHTRSGSDGEIGVRGRDNTKAISRDVRGPHPTMIIIINDFKTEFQKRYGNFVKKPTTESRALQH